MADVCFQGISKRYGGAPAVLDIDLTIPSGTFTAMIGPSGCGKSTVLEIAAGLIQPTTGHVTLAGKHVTKPGPETAIVFQHHNLFEWMTIRDNVAFGLHAQGVSSGKRRVQASKLLADVGLIEHANKLPRQLSGGMKQRVAIARALVLNPQVLLLDEPFSALDYQTRSVMQRYLLAMWHHVRATVIMVTHDLDEAIMLADQVVLFSGSPGRILDVIEMPGDRPRDPDDYRLRDIRTHLRHHLEREVATHEFTTAELAAIEREGMTADF
ncbi:MAG: ABC transporter ATP-binding protein [Elainellaceae cyanobacterium]